MTTARARPAKEETAPNERMGLPQSTALIVGSIIGVGIFSLPYSLASYGPISLVAIVSTHKSNILSKMNMTGQVELVRYAIEHHLADQVSS